MPALDRMHILDMTQYEAGTSCTQALAWLGADVVKVEPPLYGDPGRRTRQGDGNSPYFLNWNSNKRSIVLDLSQPRGRELLQVPVAGDEVVATITNGAVVTVTNAGPGPWPPGCDSAAFCTSATRNDREGEGAWFVHVRAPDGIEGWVRSEFLVWVE